MFSRPHALSVRTPVALERSDPLLRYGSALAATAVACMGTYLLWSFISPAVSLLFFIAVLFSSWYGGLRPGILCATLSTAACNYFFVVPTSIFSIGAEDLLRLSVFMMAAVFVSALTMAQTQAEETTQRIQKQLAVTLKSLGDAVIATDRKGKVCLMNAVAQSLTGWTEAEARGRGLREIFQIVDPETRQISEGVVDRVMRNNAVIALGSPVLMITRDGLEISITEVATPVRGHDGQMNGVVLVLRTAHESSFEKSESQLVNEKLTLLGSMDVPMFALDQDGICLFITKAATAMLGYHSEELVGREIHTLLRVREIHRIGLGDDDQTEIDGSFEFLRETNPAAVSGTLLRRNGVSTPVELSIAPLIVGEKVSGTVVTIADLTEHYRAEEALLKFNTIIGALEDAVVLLNLDGMITSWTRGAELIFGYSEDEVLGRHVSIIHAPARKNELGDLFRRVVAKEKIEPFETIRVGKGGEQIDVRISVAPLISPTGEVTGLAQIIKNIRDEKVKASLVNQSRQASPLESRRSRVTRFEAASQSVSSTPTHAQPQIVRTGINNVAAPAIIVGRSSVMQKLSSTIERIAPTDSSVLITGATGTGKEMVARTIHQQSLRASGPFIDINCSAIPETLIEAELFGHQKGTFTGAHEHRPGLFEAAAGGTLFLDEVDALNLSAQAKLLRVIQERRVRRIGGRSNIDIDVRIISATNSDLSLAVNNNSFRADLFYRLRVVPLHVPELYQREGDIQLLIEHFLQAHANNNGGLPRRFKPEAAKALLDYPWPGNVRELENAIEYAIAVGGDGDLGLESLPPELSAEHSQAGSGELKQVLEAYINDNVPLAEIERRYILSVLQQFGGNQVKAAAALGIDRSKLYRRLKQYGVMAVKFLQEEQDGLQLRRWDKTEVNSK
ncbi:MAG TPA: sigma 54-interacting transcriptional regulator [Pyrinomonadaceae bacterium]|nr:sigma 54-interacting transcriptional regulator [Pyrinomonadaceae bacterium]